MRTWTSRCGLAALALAVALPVIAADQTFERSLAVTGPVTLSVSTGSGDIAVRPGPDAAVKVIGTVKPNTSWGGTSPDADAAVRAVLATPPITQQGNTIEIGKFADSEMGKRVTVSYQVTVPKATALTARSGSGDLSVGDIGGPVNAQAGSGDISIGRIQAAVKVQVGSGNVAVAAAQEADVSAGSGDVNVGDTAGAVHVRTGSGDVRVQQVSTGSLEVSSGSGDVVALGLTGPAKVHTASGDVRLAGRPNADWDVNTASADVTIDIPDGTGFRVSASSMSGSITNEHTGAAAQETRSSPRDYEATVGQGGPTIHVKSASGSVTIRKAAR
jgi:DUF4097 and DUF4098 domain-containing protein YvlB